MQGRLSIKEHYIAIGHVSLYDIAKTQVIRDLIPVPVFQKLFHLDGWTVDKVGSGMNVGSVDDQLFEVLQVGRINPFGIGQDFGDVNRYTDLERKKPSYINSSSAK